MSLFSSNVNLNRRESRKSTEVDNISINESVGSNTGCRTSAKIVLGFLAHFSIVLIVLFGGAVLFAYFEDYKEWQTIFKGGSLNDNSSRTEDSRESKSRADFWLNVENKFNVTLNPEFREEFIQFFMDEMGNKSKEEYNINKEHSDIDMFVLWKWFYFAVIVSTSIGYGDISPQTESGRICFIIFSVIGMTLFMTLMNKCGAFISFANTRLCDLPFRFHRKVENKHKIDKKGAYLSLISLLLIFIAYVALGVFFESGDKHSENGSLTTRIYFWIATFSTIGLGDVTNPIRDEIENMYFYIPYRVFGLGLLAAIINAVWDCFSKDFSQEILPNKVGYQKDVCTGQNGSVIDKSNDKQKPYEIIRARNGTIDSEEENKFLFVQT